MRCALTFGRGLLITTDDALSAGGSGKAQLFANINEVTKCVFRWRRPGRRNRLVFGGPSDRRGCGLGGGRLRTWPLRLKPVQPQAWRRPLPRSILRTAPSQLTAQRSATNLTVPTTYAAIAAAIQTQIVAIGGVFAGATFTFTAGRFLLYFDKCERTGPALFWHGCHRH